MYISEALLRAQTTAQPAEAAQLQASACNHLLPLPWASLLDIALALCKSDAVHFVFYTESVGQRASDFYKNDW